MYSDSIPPGVDPLPHTLRNKDMKHQVRDLGSTFEYLLELVDPRERDLDGERLTLKPKTRANRELFSEFEPLLAAIDVRNAVTHPQDRRLPLPHELLRARDKLHRAIHDLLPRVSHSIRDRLLRDLHYLYGRRWCG